MNFTIENQGVDTVKVKDKVKFRSGDNAIWADAAKRVVKLTATSRKAKTVVLEAYEELLSAP